MCNLCDHKFQNRSAQRTVATQFAEKEIFTVDNKLVPVVFGASTVPGSTYSMKLIH